MTQEEKQILLQDLCMRLPYGVKCNFNGQKDFILKEINPYTMTNYGKGVIHHFGFSYSIEHVKPYLRPMSSMTEEEKKEYDNFLFDNLEREDVIGYEDKAFGIDVIMRYRSWEVVQWLLEHHLDFNGLIDLGLAIEAPEGIYKTE